MRAGVKEVFTLEENFRATQFLSEALGEIKRRRATAEFTQVIIKLTLEILILLRAEVFLLQFTQWMDKRLGHVSAAVGAEAAGGVRNLFTGKSTHGEGNNTKRIG